MDITPIHQTCLGVQDLLQGIIPMAMEARTQVLHLLWVITVVLLLHHITVRNKLPIRTRFPLRGVRDQINLTLQPVLGRNEQLRDSMTGARISLFPYHILFEGPTVALATVRRQRARLLTNLSLSHRTNVRDVLLDHPTIYHPCHALPTFLTTEIAHLLKDRILGIRQPQA